MTIVVEHVDTFVEAICSDGKKYSIRTIGWTLDKIQEVWGRWKDFEILSDDLPATIDGFTYYITAGGAVWFEVIDESENQVGLVYINELVPSMTTGKFISCQFHATMWDAKAGPRKELARLFLHKIVRTFGLHRVSCEIPLRFGGAIRVMKKIGFVEEGVLRSARRYRNQWYNVLLLGLLEEEVEAWARPSSQE